MKIKYKEETEKLFNIYNEAFDISLKKKKLEKKNILDNNNNFLKKSIINLIIFIIMFILLNMLFIHNNHQNNIFTYIWNIATIIYIVLTIINLFIFIIGYKDFKKQGLNGTLTITEKKIVDQSDDIKFEMSLDNITSLVIGDYSIVILTNNKIYYRLPISCKEELLDAFKTYKEDLKIIEKNN